MFFSNCLRIKSKLFDMKKNMVPNYYFMYKNIKHPYISNSNKKYENSSHPYFKLTHQYFVISV